MLKKRKLKAFMLLVIMLMMVQSFFQASTFGMGNDEEPNAVVNGGFEEGVTGWELDGTALDGAEAYTGTQSIRFGPSESGVYQQINATESTSYLLSGWGKANEGETVLLGVEMLGTDGRLLDGGRLQISYSGSSYEKKELLFLTLPGTMKVKIVGYFVPVNAGSHAYLDEIKLALVQEEQRPEPVAPVAENVNIIENNGFELDDDNWTFDGTVIDTEFPRSGLKAGKLGSGEVDAYYKAVTGWDQVEELTLSGWGMVSHNGEKGLLGVDLKNDQNERLAKYEVVFTSEKDFEYKSISFPVVPGTTKAVLYLYKTANNGGYAYFDDLSLIADKVDEAGSGSAREKVIVNSAPAGAACEPGDTPDQYAATKNDKDYFLRTYHCIASEAPRPEGAPDTYQAVDVLVSEEGLVKWYARSYKSLMAAMWVWNFDAVTDEAAREELFQFAESKGINTFYLNTGSFTTATENSMLVENPEAYQVFNRIAHEKGIAVEALDGQSSWVRAENHAQPLKRIAEVVAFNESVTDEAEKFDGIHHDNEPHTLPEWEQNKVALAADYLQLAKESRALVQGTGLTFAVDIPFWYDSLPLTYNGVTKSFDRHIIDMVDYIGIMDYRDEAEGVDGIIYHGSAEVEYAARVGKEVVIGVETIDFDDEINPEKITFWQEGEAYMNEQLSIVNEHFLYAYQDYDYKAAPGFKGYAIHHYLSFKEMKA